MSVFSDLLKNYIHEKKIKVMALAQYCDLERSTVYKFINGKREPMSAEFQTGDRFFCPSDFVIGGSQAQWKNRSFPAA